MDHWLREEAAVPAPDRLLEDVFARTETAGQARPGWAGRLGWLVRPPDRGRRSGVQRGLVGVASLVVVVGLVGVAVGSRLGTNPGAATGSASPSGSPVTPPPSGPGSVIPALVVDRTHATCARHGSLVVLPARTGVAASAWVTCGVDSEEIVLGTDSVTARPGLGLIAADGPVEWAIHGDSVVRLNPDRSIAQTVRIGTPSTIAVGSGAVWTLDTRTGQLTSIGPSGVLRTVTPTAGGRPTALAIAGGSLWVLDQTGSRLLQLDLADGRQLTAIPVTERSNILAAAAGSLYVASTLTRSIVRIDPVTGAAATLHPDLGADGHIDALGGSSETLVLGSHNDVIRLDPLTAAPGAGVRGSGYVTAVGLAGTTLIVVDENGTLLEAALP
jgi:hypothetical protein